MLWEKKISLNIGRLDFKFVQGDTHLEHTFIIYNYH